MLLKRILQFLLIFAGGLLLLLGVKYSLGLSDYVIPGPAEVIRVAVNEFNRYFFDVLDTLSVAVIGQVLSIIMALFVGIVGRQAGWFGSFVKVAAYNIQAYPIVALAPIIFILLGRWVCSTTHHRRDDLLLSTALVRPGNFIRAH